MRRGSMPLGRRERARQDKRERIVAHRGTTATVYLDRSDDAVLADIREQIRATLALHQCAV